MDVDLKKFVKKEYKSMILKDKYLGKMNDKTILASVIVYKSPFDKPDNRRWGLFCYFYDESKTGETISKIDNNRGDSFTIFPNPYQSLAENIAIKTAISFLSALGFQRYHRE